MVLPTHLDFLTAYLSFVCDVSVGVSEVLHVLSEDSPKTGRDDWQVHTQGPAL